VSAPSVDHTRSDRPPFHLKFLLHPLSRPSTAPRARWKGRGRLHRLPQRQHGDCVGADGGNDHTSSRCSGDRRVAGGRAAEPPPARPWIGGGGLTSRRWRLRAPTGGSAGAGAGGGGRGGGSGGGGRRRPRVVRGRPTRPLDGRARVTAAGGRTTARVGAGAATGRRRGFMASMVTLRLRRAPALIVSAAGRNGQRGDGGKSWPRRRRRVTPSTRQQAGAVAAQ